MVEIDASSCAANNHIHHSVGGASSFASSAGQSRGLVYPEIERGDDVWHVKGEEVVLDLFEIGRLLV